MEVIALDNYNSTNGTVQHDQGNSSRPAADSAAPVPAYSGFSPVDTYDGQPLRRKQSGLGIASFTIFASMALIFAIMLGSVAVKLTGLIDMETGVYDSAEIERRMADMPELALMSLALLGTLFGNLIGLILGIVGLVQKERKKVFAVLGTVLNGIVIVGLALLVLVSFAAVSVL
jgi:hypothetical protein